MAYLILFSFSVFLPRVQLSTFLCPLHGFPMVVFGFTTPVYICYTTVVVLKNQNKQIEFVDNLKIELSTSIWYTLS